MSADRREGEGVGAGSNGRDPATHEIIGAAMEVHNRLGYGFLESVYQDGLAIELAERRIPFEREVALPIFYRDQRIASSYRADFVCFGRVIVELKALGAITNVEQSQVINYLKATGIERGLLINFGASRLQYKRVILSKTS